MSGLRTLSSYIPVAPGFNPGKRWVRNWCPAESVPYSGGFQPGEEMEGRASKPGVQDSAMIAVLTALTNEVMDLPFPASFVEETQAGMPSV